MNFKKLILSLGTLTATAAPIAAVVACGEPDSTQYSESDLLKMSNLKSSEAHSKLQDLWLASVLKKIYKMDGTNTSNLDVLENLDNTKTGSDTTFEDDFKATLTWVLKNKLFSSKDALSSIYKSLKSNAPDLVVNSTPVSGVEKYAVKALNEKVFDRDQINDRVHEVMKGVEWKDLFYNYTFDADDATSKALLDAQTAEKAVDPADATAVAAAKETTAKAQSKFDDVKSAVFNPSILGVKDLVLKMMVTKKYLSLSSNEYKTSLPDEYVKIGSKFKDATLVNSQYPFFPLVVSLTNSRLAYETSIDLDATKSKQFIVSNVDNKLSTNDANHVFSNLDSKFKDSLPYSTTKETRVDEILAKTPSYIHTKPDVTVGFKGISALPNGIDALNAGTASSLKLVTDEKARDGFVVTDKSGTKIITDSHDVIFTDKEKTKVELHYYTSLMPVYDTVSKSLAFGNDIDIDLLMNEVYSKDSSLYSTAVKYFTSDIKDDKEQYITHYTIKIDNDWARNYYVDEGLTFIDDEK